MNMASGKSMEFPFPSPASHHSQIYLDTHTPDENKARDESEKEQDNVRESE